MKFIAGLLSVLLVIMSLPVSAFAIDLSGDSSPPAEDEIIYNRDIVEIVDMRTATDKYFRLDDGSYYAAHYNSDVHYLDDNGVWQDIDNSLAINGSEISRNKNNIIPEDEELMSIVNGEQDLTWEGRQLTSWYDGEYITIDYGYNADGIRTFKEVYDADTGDTTRHEYILSGSQIIKETIFVDGVESYTLVYLYDEAGAPLGYRYRTPSYASGVFDGYFFEKNLQGDIVAVYNQSGTKLISYTYDAWGSTTTAYLNGGGSTAARHNPFRISSTAKNSATYGTSSNRTCVSLPIAYSNFTIYRAGYHIADNLSN